MAEIGVMERPEPITDLDVPLRPWVGSLPRYGSTIASSSRAQPTLVSRSFQMTPRRPPGRSTRWNSTAVAGTSNQWNACAATIASADAVASGSASGWGDA